MNRQAAAEVQLENTANAVFQALFMDTDQGRAPTDYDDWILHPDTTYARPDQTIIGTTDSDGVFSSELTNSTLGENIEYWTAISTGGSPGFFQGSTCDSLTNSNAWTMVGFGDAVSGSAFAGFFMSCSTARPVLCVEQTYAPQPTGDIGVQVTTNQSVTIDFPAAVDVDASQTDTSGTLRYAVVYSTSDNIDSTSDALENGTFTDYEAYDGEIELIGLTTGTTYYLTVIVKDEDDNLSTYNTLNTTPQTLRFWVTNETTNGDIGGISGADTMCGDTNDANYPVPGGTFAAMIVDGSDRTLSSDWVLLPDHVYYNSDGTTILGWTDEQGRLEFPLTVAPLSDAPSEAWTGLDSDWTTHASHCTAWPETATFGKSGEPELTDADMLSGTETSCSFARVLYCVEQPELLLRFAFAASKHEPIFRPA